MRRKKTTIQVDAELGDYLYRIKEYYGIKSINATLRFLFGFKEVEDKRGGKKKGYTKQEIECPEHLQWYKAMVEDEEEMDKRIEELAENTTKGIMQRKDIKKQ